MLTLTVDLTARGVTLATRTAEAGPYTPPTVSVIATDTTGQTAAVLAMDRPGLDRLRELLTAASLRLKEMEADGEEDDPFREFAPVN